jgi:RNA polymerase sigma-70 factor, ECF subfamily
VTRTEEFEELRPLLFSVAYRILGSVNEAEDAVQETWLRYEAATAQPTSAKAFLSAVVTRISIDVLRSARVRREEYVGQWFPEPLLTDPYEDPERSAELADSVSMAALLLLERLSPLERAVFVLREVFGFGFPEVASAVGRSEVACRQLAARARRHMDAGRPRFEADRRERDELAARFFDALKEGDVEGLRELLAADVQVIGDSGGKAPQLSRSVIGADKVARLLAAYFPRLVSVDVTMEPHEVNGQPGAIFRDRDGKVLNALVLDVLDGRIQTIRSVQNPDKLRHVGPVADAWAVAREINQMRRREPLRGDQRVGERVDAGQVPGQVVAEMMAGGQRRRRVVGDLGLLPVGPDQHLERQVKRGKRGGHHHRGARGRAAEDYQRGLPQREADLAGLGALVDDGEDLQPLGAEEAGELGHGVGHRVPAELGDDVRLVREPVPGHGGSILS